MDRLPSPEDILAWIEDNPDRAATRDIAKAFGVTGAARRELKALVRELRRDGTLPERRSARGRGGLPPVTLIEVTGLDDEGTPLARATDWQGEGQAPIIRLVESRRAAGPGDRILARLAETENGIEARAIRHLATEDSTVLGIFRDTPEGGRIEPVGKGESRVWRVAKADQGGARDGELVEAARLGGARTGLPRARITKRVGDPGAPRSISLIAIHEHGLRHAFPEDVIAEAEALEAPGLEDGREDLRHLPLVTIDPVDARDHDDAVFAESDPDPSNPDGHILWVAIADVAHFVRPGGALDAEARLRGNSTYFADRVVPMLPERLSGDLCSLHEDADRAVIALRMVLAEDGTRRTATLHRGLMRSRASLHYDEVQDAIEGTETPRIAPLMDEVIRPLHAAWGALRRARSRRTPLDLDLPEREIRLDDAGRVTSVGFRARRDAHRLIEDCMVAANATVAEMLLSARTPHVTRAHEEPEPKKLEALREAADAAGIPLAKGQRVTPRRLNGLLDQARGTPHEETLSMAVLRAMPQAHYLPQNLGHFGLDLAAYVHFTSPIRRYADLIVHRAIYACEGWADWRQDTLWLEETATLISLAERRSMEAERDTADRYLAAYLTDRVGATFHGTVSGVQKFGVFVRLEDTGADGLIPVRSLGAEYHRFDREAQALEGVETGRVFRPGQRLEVRLVEASPMTGGLILELIDGGEAGSERRRGSARRSKGRPRRAKPRRRA